MATTDFKPPAEGALVWFIRTKLLPINIVVAFTGLVVGILDFLTPIAPFLLIGAASLVFLLLLVVVARAVFDPNAGNASFIERIALAFPPVEQPFWRSPRTVFLTIIVAIFAVATIANQMHKREGGFLSAHSTKMGGVQRILMNIDENTASIDRKLGEQGKTLQDMVIPP